MDFRIGSEDFWRNLGKTCAAGGKRQTVNKIRDRQRKAFRSASRRYENSITIPTITSRAAGRGEEDLSETRVVEPRLRWDRRLAKSVTSAGEEIPRRRSDAAFSFHICFNKFPPLFRLIFSALYCLVRWKESYNRALVLTNSSAYPLVDWINVT